MKNKLILSLFLILVSLNIFSQQKAEILSTDVMIVGGGASGTMAGIQAARMGVSVLIVEETPWLGGMLTSAGVSAADGNYRLRSGLWYEFMEKLFTHYGDADSVKTGWVSNVLFEPHVGEAILSNMTKAETNLSVFRNTRLIDIQKIDEGWEAVINQGIEKIVVNARIVIDATEMGDVAKRAGIPYDIGMDARSDTGEDIAPEKANDIIQDLTYVAILKDYGDTVDVTIPRPYNYDPSPFYCTCAGKCDEDSLGTKLWDCDFMMEYGKLPNGYYMINWPIYGNDYYVNALEMSTHERDSVFQKAKDFTLNYIYYLQHELGYKNLGIANDVFPTDDGLPLIPYHRESRRIKGLVRYTVNDMARPFEQNNALYRTGIAVGDYPVDHHRQRYPDAHLLPELHFYPVPSYNLPLGVMIPKGTKDMVVAEKSISVSNIVNGTTRLQPVCLLIGQASGVLAALSVQLETTPEKVSVRSVQNQLLKHEAYLMPYSDIKPEHAVFNALQRIGATGILRGEGKNIGWENHTHIYPDSIVTRKALQEGLSDWLPVNNLNFNTEEVSFSELLKLIDVLDKTYNPQYQNLSLKVWYKKSTAILKKHNLQVPTKKECVSRATFALLLDELLNPFELRQVDHTGKFMDDLCESRF
ncbi:ribulose 1,5-bisphosphate synthetase/thiazole synthase [Saccharicrinis carchari]|uniref:Ribulose 1,5-bisphosphate synthetase/thiazole synthase n=1 Tax=Saccharicrinis carchari TaxID=1168039 RepID=A0A521F7U4_SACCC|nr:FAD-dependent oxidoreductase [Saccharicrinis carchari]SMO91671.1 ribulose 1,5-bisphosphate synthetase/thiazole synthase [Saccharicrinis carchari]